MPFYSYILRRANGTLYYGSTGDLQARMREHREGRVRSTRGLRPLVLVWFEEYASKAEATRREFSLKNGRTRRETIKALIDAMPAERLAPFRDA